MSQIMDDVLEQVRRHCLVDPNDAEEMSKLQDDVNAAWQYLSGSDVNVSAADELSLLAVRRLAIYWHESVGPDRQYGYPDPPPDLNALILNLRYKPMK